jgi:hypothetical protein
MNTILEKFVEAELFHEGIRAYFNGFTAWEDQVCGIEFKRMRQVQLAPYGIADIVNIVFPNREHRTLLIQVIECKRDMVNMATYAQAKRYLTALRQALAPFVAEFDNTRIKVKWECVLVGHRLETDGDFVYILNEDPACKVFTYHKEGGELLFTERHSRWGYHSQAPHPAHDALHRIIGTEFPAAWDRAEAALNEFHARYNQDGTPKQLS